jgi:hypothetical protein
VETGDDLHVKALVPVWIQSLLDDTGGVSLLCVNSNDGKGVWKTKDVALG